MAAHKKSLNKAESDGAKKEGLEVLIQSMATSSREQEWILKDSEKKSNELAAELEESLSHNKILTASRGQTTVVERRLAEEMSRQSAVIMTLGEHVSANDSEVVSFKKQEREAHVQNYELLASMTAMKNSRIPLKAMVSEEERRLRAEVTCLTNQEREVANARSSCETRCEQAVASRQAADSKVVELKTEVEQLAGAQQDAEFLREETLRMREHFKANSIAANADLTRRMEREARQMESEMHSLKSELDTAIGEKETIKAESVDATAKWQAIENCKYGQNALLKVQLVSAKAEVREARTNARTAQEALIFQVQAGVPKNIVHDEMEAEKSSGILLST